MREWGEPNLDDCTESLALCKLCGVPCEGVGYEVRLGVLERGELKKGGGGSEVEKL